MKKSAIVSGLGMSLLLCSMACQKEGLATSGGSGGAAGGLAQGGSGTGGVASSGGVVGTGGLSTSGGAPGVGGAMGSGGAPGNGGATGTGGVALGTGGKSGTGGATLATGGRVGSGGAISTGGVLPAGGTVGTGGAVAAGGSIGTGGKTGTGGGAGGVAGTGGSTGRICGTIAGLVCPSGQFCEMPAGACSRVADGAGTCVPSGARACPAIYSPVCGCDGVTYGNDCERQAAGVSKSADGACATPTSACPADISQISTWTCTEGLTCEYGTDPRPGCRASATCTGGAWVTTSAKCTQLPPVTCPATRTDAAGQSCPTDGAYCVYADLSCACTNCTDGPVVACGGALTWHCAAPNADASCPAGIPLLGSACSVESQSCGYSCGTGGARLCKKGAWYSANGGPCPVSARRAKKDIVYVGTAERERIAADLARFKLATYEYRDPALAGTRHLGFIIDDVPGSPAVDRDGNMVDLYGYASMLVAAVQAQGEEIAKLKAELKRMKVRVRGK